MRLVVDASVVLRACLERLAFAPLDGHELVAPVLLRSEVLSALHEAQWRREISPALAAAAREQLVVAPVEHPALTTSDAAWVVADRLGWAKTYDAEYVALAEQEDLPLVTLDARLAKGARRLVRTLSPAELHAG